MDFLEKLNKNTSPNEDELNTLLMKIDFSIDKDYLLFINRYNGAEGFISKENYVLLWNIQDLIALNPYYEDEPQCNNYFFFGSNGSNLGYAFDKIKGGIISIDFLEIGSVEPFFIAKSFGAFGDNLSQD